MNLSSPPPAPIHDNANRPPPTTWEEQPQSAMQKPHAPAQTRDDPSRPILSPEDEREWLAVSPADFNRKEEAPMQPLEQDDKPWKSLLERGVIKEIENEGGIFDQWRREIEEGFGIHWEDDKIYNYGESVVCRCVEGVFVFDDEGFGLARLIARADMEKVVSLLTGDAYGPREEHKWAWKWEVVDRAGLRLRPWEEQLRILAVAPRIGTVQEEGQWRAAGSPYDADAPDELNGPWL
jgi:hypothetical protein